MDDTLDLDYSCSSEEIIAKSPELEPKTIFINREIIKAQQMLDNLKLNYMRVNSKYKIMHKSNSHIIRENLRLKRRIEELERKLAMNIHVSKPPTGENETSKKGDQSLSLSTILNSSSLLETTTSRRCCCCQVAGNMGSNRSTNLCSFYQFRCNIGTKRSRPPSWFVEKPKKKLLNEIVLSQLSLFKF